MYGVDGVALSRQYKHHISNFNSWEQQLHAHDYVLFKNNIGSHLSMDETCLSQGELYTIITNKSAQGKRGSLVAMLKGTKSDVVLHYLRMLPHSQRLKVKEITVDLSPSMMLIAKSAFPRAVIVSDRFHVQKLMNEAVSDLRVAYRWEAIDQENEEIKLAKELRQKFIPHLFANGDTRRQLLARSRHIVMKHFSKWTESQCIRAEILFREYPAIEEAYNVSMELTDIYNKTRLKSEELLRINELKGSVKQTAMASAIARLQGIARAKLAKWYEKVVKLNSKYFNSVITTMENHNATIVNYFINRSTNASAESFNAKVKAFRAQFRGVRDIPFFIFRLTKLFA